MNFCKACMQNVGPNLSFIALYLLLCVHSSFKTSSPTSFLSSLDIPMEPAQNIPQVENISKNTK